MIDLVIGKIPLANWVSSATDWITSTFSSGFDVIQKSGTVLMNGITGALTAVPFWLMIAVVTILAILVSGKSLPSHCLLLLVFV